jgi:hypothetical protein
MSNQYDPTKVGQQAEILGGVHTLAGLARLYTNIPAGSTAYTSDGGPQMFNGVSWQAGSFASASVAAPKNVILDCQFVADVFPSAVRLLAWAHKIGVINLLAVTNNAGDANTSPNPAAQVASQILTTAGVTGVPLSSGPTTTTFNATESESLTTFLAQSFTPARRLLSIAGISTSVPVLRSALANAVGSVDIVTGGPLNNLYDLLNSPADSISPLTGAQLITGKVGTLYCMGGQYPKSTAAVGGEYNFGNIAGFTATLWAATNGVLTSWPTPIVFVGFELGPFASCGAYYALTPTDPVGYYYANWSQSTAGRHGWNEIVALIGLAGPAKAGFTTVAGTNSINVSNGFNTFTPGAGSHSYVIPVVSQRAIQQICDAINAPGVTQPTAFNQVAEIVTTTFATSSQIDGANLISWYYAPDLGLTNGASIASWPDRCGRANLVQATAGLQPTYNTALVSKVAVSFDGVDDALVGDASIDIPHNCTLYAYVECNAFDTTFDTIMTHGASTGSTNIRDVFMDRSRTNESPASSVKANTVIQNTFTNAIATAALTLNTWAVLALVRNGGTITAYMNGAAPGSTSIATPANFDSLTNAVSNHIVGPLTVGSQYVNATPVGINPWNGGMREIRIYNNAHTAAQVAAVSTAMTT